jgi:hypothetical protein
LRCQGNDGDVDYGDDDYVDDDDDYGDDDDDDYGDELTCRRVTTVPHAMTSRHCKEDDDMLWS